MNRIEDSTRDLWEILNTPAFKLQGKNRKRETEKISENIIVENFPNMRKEIANKVQEAQNLIQDKPKEKHIMTHTNQANAE